MLVCPYCGAQNADDNAFCSNCGAALKDANQPQQNFEVNEKPAQTYQQNDPGPQQTYQQNQWNYAPQPIAPIPTGGLMAWSIITILLCTIPGIVALVNTLGINKAATLEEQQTKMSSARMWCIIGTILGIIAIIGNLAARGSM